MKIYSTWTNELSAFRRFFEGHEVELLPQDFSKVECDLLIFPGGDDVHPARYGMNIPEDSLYSSWINPERDEWELGVMKAVLTKEFQPKKVFGVCRGMQLLNVALGGNLIYDIQTRYGIPHSSHHNIHWKIENLFSSIEVVNSLHHQAIYSTGDRRMSRPLGIEPSTRIVEAILWGDTILGVQFHPELWGNSKEMRIMSEGILEWVSGKSFVTGPTLRERPRVGRTLEDLEKSLADSFQTGWTYQPNPVVFDTDDDDDDFNPDLDDEEEELL